VRFKAASSIILIALFGGLAIPARAAGNKANKITVFDAPGAGLAPGSYNGTQAFGINLLGEITGYVCDDNSVCHGFVRYPDGRIATFDAPGGGTVPGWFQGTEGIDINLEGEITGYVVDGSNLSHGFVRYPNGRITVFDAPGAGTDGSQFQGTFAYEINDLGEVAGFYQDSANVFHGFVRAFNGKITTFDAPGAGTGAYQGTEVLPVHSLNLAGDLAGYFVDSSKVLHGFLRTANGKITTFDAPGAGTGGGEGTYGHSINLEGEISGTVVDGSFVRHAYFRARDGKFTTFDAPGAGSAIGSFYGTTGPLLNVFGTVAGDLWDSYGVVHSYVRTRSGAITVFDAPGAGSAQFVDQGTYSYGVNDLGVISGFILDENNVYHAFVRNP
jgi:hypothetical protein